MGFWKKFGKALAIGGAGLAAPFTGGVSLATIIPAIAGTAGAIATGIGSQRQGDRLVQGRANQEQDILKQRAAQMLEDALMNRQQLDLQQRQFQLNAPGQRAGNSVRGDVLANAQDAGVSGPITHTGGQIPTLTGGLRPSMFSGSTRQLGGQMSRDALLGQMKGDQFTPMPAPKIPGVTPLPQAGKLDTALDWIGGVGNSLGALDAAGLFGSQGPLAQARKPQVPPLPIGNPHVPRFAGWAPPDELDNTFGDFY